MYEKKRDSDIRCPLEYGLEIIGKKWNSRVICILYVLGTLRYSQIRQEMLDITDAVLSATLKALIASGMVTRQSYDQVPPRVEYSLTEKGRSVVPILRSICAWSGEYHQNAGPPPMQQCKTCYYYNWDDPAEI